MAKPFAGKDTKAEEMAEAKSVRSGKTTPSKYAASEAREESMGGGHMHTMPQLLAVGVALSNGSLSPQAYASTATGICCAPNERMGNQGPGVRSLQDFKKIC